MNLGTPGLFEALADAFADEERKGAEVYEIVVGRTALRAIKASSNWEAKSRSLWGAEVKLDLRFKRRVILRYRRSKSGSMVPAPSGDDKLRRFRKTVMLKGDAVPGTG